MLKKTNKLTSWITVLIMGMVIFSNGLLFLKEVIADSTGSEADIKNSSPVIGTIVLNGGNDIILTENTTTTVQATATVGDTDEYGDIASVIGKLYRSGVGSGCTADDNNCYSDSACATSSCSASSCIATCEYEVWFHAEPTDASSSYSSQNWEVWMKAIDSSNASSSATSGEELNTLYALSISHPYEYHSSGEDGNSSSIYSSTYYCYQIIDIGSVGQNIDHYISAVNLKLYRVGSPNTTTVKITSSYEGSVLSSGTINGNNITTDTNGEWYKISLSPFLLSSSTSYYVSLYAEGNSSNYIIWKLKTSNAYGNGDSYGCRRGITVSKPAYPGYDAIFEEYGEGGVINYGGLKSGSTTGSVNQTSTVIVTGNSNIFVSLYGTDLENGANSIGVGYQEYSTGSFTYGAGNNLSEASSTIAQAISKPTTHPSDSSSSIYWGAEVPANTPKGIYSGTTTFEAVNPF